MSAPFPNLYTHRKVAESAAKTCDVCYKPSTSVLITPDKKIDEAALKAKREKEIAEETEKLKKEYEERQRKKKEKESKDKDKKDDKEKDKDTDKKDSKDEEKAADQSAQKSKDEGSGTSNEEPRVFELKRFELWLASVSCIYRANHVSAFYQQRLQRKRQVEAAKRDRERVSQPGYFPSVPSAPPAK
ncbi:hypothetical protein MAA_05491 [Metarhizium robertsii ARSEF 23]|uniref:Uncharacterized protein n=1 Tax=Metarhizium robertsii (strain ARSEF 23 / ATCC MYA-3075) TaxID=655844 RepID=E9EZP2_METRA|nr:uncharacterized protein MAA_05491 [Metarhizium robertsii ARSEF 23]EFY99433.1 hypothetical protein MAA_05491 [Metarhizium robertsii ARSEF 23]